MSTPDPSWTPPEAPVNPPPDAERGTLLAGFLLGWAVMVASCAAGGMLLALLGNLATHNSELVPMLFGLVSLLPLLSMIALLVWFASKGKPRSAAGVALAFGSMIALVLLLVAACFGLLANTNFH